ncbi:PQQ-dependent sugar dehydrogenase [Proteiniclasticum sp. C24MP]|uniref:PQQ-dependent sugar dehydrogenase n=1 Tax=Proteiniclasticum sp. C24MP TaxID=3374101 RepID=UPI0037547439
MKKLLILLLALILTACSVDSVEEPEPSDPVLEEPQEAPAEKPPVVDQPKEEDPSQENPYTVPDEFQPARYEVEDPFSSLSFKEPLALVSDGVDDDRIYVVERGGTVYQLHKSDASSQKIPFLDLTEAVDTSGLEMGLLGLAFHPDYDENGYLFVNYTRSGETVISRFSSSDRETVDLTSEKILLTYSQPYSNHNGGSLLFGPDGYLYISSGDGGSSGDPNDEAQNLTSYLGKMLRIDVDTEDHPYLIPEDNPFLYSEEARAEIYAYGLRNPWKFSFDEGRDLLIAADVGQGEIEEIDLIVSGGNYGWNRFEGTRTYREGETLENHILPVYEYPHSEGRSITGGFTYYGEALESLQGAYIYGDFISGTIWALWLDDEDQAENHTLLDTDLMISSFGLDNQGELYIVDFQGKIYTLKEEE